MYYNYIMIQYDIYIYIYIYTLGKIQIDDRQTAEIGEMRQ